MWPSYVINLADNAGRLARSAAQLDGQGLPWSRIEGVNGWQLTDEAVARVYDAGANAARAKHPLVRPEIGCYLSHLAAWEAIATGEAPGGFVFEDDFAAGEDLGEALDLLSRPQEMWDMVKLFSFDPDPRMVREQPLGRFAVGIPYRIPTCLIGYGLTRAAAARLEARALPFFRPVDEDQKYFWETGLRVALIRPAPVLVGDQQAETGTIGDARRGKAGGGRSAPAQALHNLRYQLGYAARLHYHRLMGHGG